VQSVFLRSLQLFSVLSLFRIFVLFRSDSDARHSQLADESRRPNFFLSEAEAHVARLRGTLLPLLDEAERRMRAMEARHFVRDGALLSRIAAASGRAIVQNAGMRFCLVSGGDA
jgi:hypothetical protein